ncbi:ATP-binding protein [Salidesulfovibrio onnuriiensis]|uniref:ATP-binding protein n=1 Tax=Salidesulfovibrio onnuriiensis TaxID=2583823 RepID=UPI0011C9CF79|nr:ATP-binding protein [Salidesulfovibrio onnuriiensis]
MTKRFNNILGSISPWVVIGMSLILVAVVLVLAAMNYNREKQYMGRVLSEKGAALIKSFEAGTRTGMMGLFGDGPTLQVLLEEISTQPDILYIAVVDASGEILAHSDEDQIGRKFSTAEAMAGLNATEETQWRVVDTPGAPKAFEAYKLFLPVAKERPRSRHRGSTHHRGRRMMQGLMWGDSGNASGESCQPGWMRGLKRDKILDPVERPVIFIGMDVAPFEAAVAEDVSLTLTMSGILLLLGLGGVMSLFWMQSHLRSRKLLQDSRALTAEIVSNIPEGLVVCDSEGRITYVNEIVMNQLVRQFESPAQLVGQQASALLPAELWELRSLVDREHPVVERELELGLNGGRKLPISAVVTDILADDGTHVGQLFMVRDLSQVKELQAEIRKADRMAAIGHLAAGVAHEVRNPLSSIKGYATYFGSLFEKDSENRKAAEVMTSEVDRLNRVISELLEMARPADIKLRNTDVAALLEGSLRLVRQEAEASGVSVSLDIAEDVGAVDLDPDRLTQAMINLYVNAVQAMPEGGRLDVRADREEDALRLTVADTGPGLPHGDVSRIFDPYFTTKQAGTGLGLAIVSKIIEAHSGEIRVEHTGPEGTAFTILIPIEKEGAYT